MLIFRIKIRVNTIPVMISKMKDIAATPNTANGRRKGFLTYLKNPSSMERYTWGGMGDYNHAINKNPINDKPFH